MDVGQVRGLSTLILDKRLLGPIVYLISIDKTLLYIGSSVKGIRRFSSHKILTQALVDDPRLSIEIIFCNSELEARDREYELQKELRPLIDRARDEHENIAAYAELKREKEVRYQLFGSKLKA